MLVTSIFSFSHNVFYSLSKMGKNHHVSHILLVDCKCFQFGPSETLSFGKEVGLHDKG